MEPNDHDLLIKLNTLVETIHAEQKAFHHRYEIRHTDLVNRVATLETKDSRDSEKFKGLAEEIRRSLANSARIDAVAHDLNNLGVKVARIDVGLEELGERTDNLQSKSDSWDRINSVAAAASGIIGFFFGNK